MLIDNVYIFIFAANVMYLSFQKGDAAELPTSHSKASGLSPPYAGKMFLFQMQVRYLISSQVHDIVSSQHADQ